MKKVSLCSVESNKIATNDKKIIEKCEGTEPADRFYYVHVLFILLGLLHFLPLSFFVTANAYWMHKFRNVSADITNTEARTPLQTHFSPGCTIGSTVPVLIFMVVSSLYGYKIKARVRVLVALLVITICFVLMTGFVKINTDSWQFGFFVLTMAVLAVINGTNAVLEIAFLTILSKFPPYYMKIYLAGQGFAGIFNALLQIFTLALGTSTTTSALVYFVVGSAIMGFTLILFYFSKHSKCYSWHIKNSEEDTKRNMIPFSEMKSLLKTLWLPIVMFIFIMLTLLPTHTAVTSLVVSENYGNGNPWNDKYFVPVITFLFSEVTGLMGRITSSKVNMSINGFLLTFIMFVRMMVLVPLIYFCNAQPRTHFDVLLPHDWQYIIVLGILNFTTGYAFNMMYLDVRKSVQPEKVEDAYMVFMAFTAVLFSVLTPISVFAVELL